jgi:hypothetical protein
MVHQGWELRIHESPALREEEITTGDLKRK